MQSTTYPTDHVQLQLPLRLTESRSARLARVLSLTAGKVAPASSYTFTAKAAIAASTIARKEYLPCL